LPPRSASTRFGLYSLNGFVASISIPRWQAAQRVLDIRPGNGEQDIVKACGRRDRGRRRAVPKLGNLAGKRFWTSSAAQHHFMASRQGFPRERKRDRAGADRSELHDAAS
jgi:hypothetical protein